MKHEIHSIMVDIVWKGKFHTTALSAEECEKKMIALLRKEKILEYPEPLLIEDISLAEVAVDLGEAMGWDMRTYRFSETIDIPVEYSYSRPDKNGTWIFGTTDADYIFDHIDEDLITEDGLEMPELDEDLMRLIADRLSSIDTDYFEEVTVGVLQEAIRDKAYPDGELGFTYAPVPGCVDCSTCKLNNTPEKEGNTWACGGCYGIWRYRDNQRKKDND